jgi:hypothetical protein
VIRPPYRCSRCGKTLFECCCEEPGLPPLYNLAKLPSLSLSRMARVFIEVCEEERARRGEGNKKPAELGGWGAGFSLSTTGEDGYVVTVDAPPSRGSVRTFRVTA